MKQLKFKGIPRQHLHFGGVLIQNKRKTQRPLSFKNPIHCVLKSQTIDKSTSFVKYQRDVHKIFNLTAKHSNIKIYQFSINFNHAHIVIHCYCREQYTTFIRLVTSRIVRLLEVKLKRSLKGLFTTRPFTRIVTWGRDFIYLLKYAMANSFESEGIDVWQRYKCKLQSG